jgi:hypothetical protein
MQAELAGLALLLFCVICHLCVQLSKFVALDGRLWNSTTRRWEGMQAA